MRPAILNLVFLAAVATGYSVEPNNSAKNLLDAEFSWSSGPGMDDFLYICSHLRIPCGEEKFESDVLSGRPEYKSSYTTPRAILNAIVSRYPGYQWYFANDVLLMRLPAKKRAVALQTRIPDFSFSNISVVGGINAVADRMGIASPGRALVGPTSQEAEKRKAESRAKKISIHLQNETAERILCGTVSAHGHALWQLIHRSRLNSDSSGLYVEAEVY